MFDDTAEGTLFFYTESGSSMANSSYSRAELKEQMVPGSNNINWTFVYDDVHMKKCFFENYFKAGNYLVTLGENDYVRVKYYDLEVTH